VRPARFRARHRRGGQRGQYFAQRAVELATGDATVWNLYAAVHGIIGDDTRAIEAYRRALDIEPDRLDAIEGLATLLQLRQAYAEAGALAQRFLQRAPATGR